MNMGDGTMRFLTELVRTRAITPALFALMIAVSTGALVLPNPATAQTGFNLWRSGGADLSAEDMQLLRTAVAEALDSRTDGTTVPWSNPDTGNAGEATLLRAFTDQGTECGDMKITVARRQGATTPYNLKFCQRDDGTWGIAP